MSFSFRDSSFFCTSAFSLASSAENDIFCVSTSCWICFISFTYGLTLCSSSVSVLIRSFFSSMMK